MYCPFEKLFFAAEDGQGRLLWLGAVYSSGQGNSKISEVNPYFDGNVLKKFTGSHWREIKSFVKKRRLTLKHKPELMETLLYYQKLELEGDSRSPY